VPGPHVREQPTSRPEPPRDFREDIGELAERQVIEGVQRNNRVECRGREFQPCHICVDDACAWQNVASTAKLLEGNINACQRELVNQMRPSVATAATEVQDLRARRQVLDEILQLVNGSCVNRSVRDSVGVPSGYPVVPAAEYLSGVIATRVSQVLGCGPPPRRPSR
jgi:hypothetical protein